MADGPTAGSVFLEFKAELEGVNRAFAAIMSKLDQMGAKGAQAGAQVEKGSARAAGGFDAIEKASVRAATKVAAVAGRMVNLQFAIASLMQGPASLGRLGTAITSAGQGLQIFSALASGATGKAQLFAAGFAGIAVAVTQYVTQALQAAIDATDKLTKTTESATRSIDLMATALADAEATGKVFGATYGERMAKQLDISKASMDRILQRLRDIKTERVALRQEANGNTDPNNPTVQAIGALNFEEERLRDQLADLEKRGLGLKAAADVGKIVDETNKLVEALDDVQAFGKSAIAEGLSTPLAVAEDQLKAAEAVLSSILKKELAIRDALLNPGLTDAQRNELNAKRPSGTDFGVARSDVDEARRKLAAAQAPQKFADSFATPFAQGIADGLVRGVQEGKSAVETLAGIGENLFSNMLGNAADNFVSLMSEGFTAIAGAGGDILGNLFSGLAGVAGALFSNRKSKGGSKFDAVESAVTSTQEVRGIVAGPTSIPIAQVENNLATAIVPVVSGIEATNALLYEIKRILSNGSGRGVAPGRFPAASTAG